MSTSTSGPFFSLGSEARPLRVAIVGAGPSGFYAAGSLLSRRELHVRVEIIEALPTPFGLVRAGVAPDHANIRRVAKVFARTGADPRVHFHGNVRLGHDLSLDTLRAQVDAVVFCTGAEQGRPLQVPGGDLPGVWSAADFVYWVNAHPDWTDRDFDLEGVRRAVVVGNGNVAMDVARVLAHDPCDLAGTDISAHAMAALWTSGVEEVVVLGRRGPMQAAFTPKEAQELGRLAGADVLVDAAELEQDAATACWLASGVDSRREQKNLSVLKGLSQRRPRGRARRLRLRFRVSPVAFEAGPDGRLASVRLQPNEQRFRDGRVRPEAAGEAEDLPAQLVLTAIGYRSSPVESLPFDPDLGRPPSEDGRVLDLQTRQPLPGLYVAGWLKRGPTGLIGTNKGDSVQTVSSLVDDLVGTEVVAREPVELAELLRAAGGRPVSWEEWSRLDAEELRRGQAVGKARERFTSVPEMLGFLDQG